MKYRLKGEYAYQAWPESVHSARTLRKIARSHELGRNHLVSASVVMTAFSFEAFTHTLGPEAYGQEAWSAAVRPAERDTTENKLKMIGRKFGVPVNYGAEPWRKVKLLLKARSDLAHPKDRPWPVNGVYEAESEEALSVDIAAIIRKEHLPLHDLDILDALVEQTEPLLLQMWAASGRNRHILSGWGGTLWSISAAR